MNLKKSPTWVVAILAVAIFSVSCKKSTGTEGTTPTPPPVDTSTTPPPVDTSTTNNDNDHMLLGNPSGANSNVLNFGNYLMIKPYYKLSYNNDRGTPNWVSWHLYANDLGNVNRADDFRADNTLPFGWYAVPDNAYSGSGFDRGHNCPSGDRTNTDAANSATFLMTNMIPQAPVNNQQTWANMENYLRTLVQAGNELFIVMGSYGEGGTGSNGYKTKINNDHVTVPSRIWKIALVMPNGNNDLARINGSMRIIAVDVPNDNTTVTSNWKVYRTSVKAIETSTGYNLLSALPASVKAELEVKVDNQ